MPCTWYFWEFLILQDCHKYQVVVFYRFEDGKQIDIECKHVCLCLYHVEFHLAFGCIYDVYVIYIIFIFFCNMLVAMCKGKWLDMSYFQTSKLLAMIMLLITSKCVEEVNIIYWRMNKTPIIANQP
jgi:hypothetical protein